MSDEKSASSLSSSRPDDVHLGLDMSEDDLDFLWGHVELKDFDDLEVDYASGPCVNYQEWKQGWPNGPPFSEQQKVVRDICDDAYKRQLRKEKITDEEKKVYVQCLSNRIDSFHKIRDGPLVSWKGIKLDWFLNCFAKTPEVTQFGNCGCEMWFVRNVGIPEILRRRKQQRQGTEDTMSGLFIDHVVGGTAFPEEEKDLEKAGDHRKTTTPILVAQATLFISYSGSTTLKEIIESLSYACNHNPSLRNEYMWWDAFCVDQFAWTLRRDAEITAFKEEFMYQLQHNIERIGFTLVLVPRWNDLLNTFGKMWVVWEIFLTANCPTANLEVLLHEIDTLSIMERNGGAFRLEQGFRRVDIASAKAFHEEDRTLILNIVAKSCGESHINDKVRRALREGMVKMARTQYSLADTVESSKGWIANSLANMYCHFGVEGSGEEIERLYLESISRRHQVLGANHKDTLASVQNLIAWYDRVGRTDDAKELCSKYGIAG